MFSIVTVRSCWSSAISWWPERVADYMQATDPTGKTIVFCVDIAHAERMRQQLVNAIGGEAVTNRRFVMRITGDSPEGKQELDNFIDPGGDLPGGGHDLQAADHRRGCADVQADCAGRAAQLHDRVQADHRPRHPAAPDMARTTSPSWTFAA